MVWLLISIKDVVLIDVGLLIESLVFVMLITVLTGELVGTDVTDVVLFGDRTS